MRWNPSIAPAIAALALVSAAPAAAYPLKITGRTLATPRLQADLLRAIAGYSKSSGGCSFLFSVQAQVLPRTYVPVRPAPPAVARGGHFEAWTVNACGARQRFQIGLWPSPRGGADYAITPLTGRMPLTSR